MSKKSARRPGPVYDNDIGRFLHEARQLKRMTLSEVAEKLGLRSGQSVWDWENGKGAGIPAIMLLRVVKLYSISEEEAYDQLLRFQMNKAQVDVQKRFQLAKKKFRGA